MLANSASSLALAAAATNLIPFFSFAFILVRAFFALAATLLMLCVCVICRHLRCVCLSGCDSIYSSLANSLLLLLLPAQKQRENSLRAGRKRKVSCSTRGQSLVCFAGASGGAAAAVARASESKAFRNSSRKLELNFFFVSAPAQADTSLLARVRTEKVSSRKKLTLSRAKMFTCR